MAHHVRQKPGNPRKHSVSGTHGRPHASRSAAAHRGHPKAQSATDAEATQKARATTNAGPTEFQPDARVPEASSNRREVSASVARAAFIATGALGEGDNARRVLIEQLRQQPALLEQFERGAKGLDGYLAHKHNGARTAVATAAPLLEHGLRSPEALMSAAGSLGGPELQFLATHAASGAQSQGMFGLIAGLANAGEQVRQGKVEFTGKDNPLHLITRLAGSAASLAPGVKNAVALAGAADAAHHLHQTAQLFRKGSDASTKDRAFSVIHSATAIALFLLESGVKLGKAAS
jgi:hypothetical protein